MAKPRGVEAKLIRLHELREEPMSAQLVTELRPFLRDGSNLVVAEAATLVGNRTVKELAPELAAAFDRLMIDPEENDKHCRGKIALIEALNKIEYSQPEVYFRGIKHVQEPRWEDPTQDAAGPLRAHCALGLAHIGHPDLLPLLTEMLLDKDNAARTGVVRALAVTGSLAAVPLLRFKALIGDPLAEVMGECFASLLSLSPDETLAFVARFLQNGDETVQSEAVFALAETRRPEAFALLLSFWPQTPDGLKDSVLLGMAMSRVPAALEFLINIIAQRDPAARAALSALAIHRHSSKIKESVAAAVLANADPDVQQWFKKKFPDDGG